MINLRYHIVSITAVFLALGIGVALGSTFLDRATVGRIDDNLRSAENDIRETRAENHQLSDTVGDAQERDETLIAESDVLFDDVLTARPVLIVVAPGVDQGTVDTLREVLDNADADLRGSLALADELTQVDEDLDDDLVAALDLTGVEPADAHDAVNAALVEALVAAGAEDEGDSAVGPDGTQPTIVTALLDADLATLDPGHDDEDPILERAGYQYLYLAQPDLDPAADQLLLDLLPTVATSPPLPASVVSVTPEPPGQDEEPLISAVDLVRQDDERSALYTTVDDIDTFMGMWSTVMVLAADQPAVAAHYGQGEGATALLPAVR